MRLAAIILFSSVAISCSKREVPFSLVEGNVALRPLNNSEAIEEFHEIVNQFKTLYGPLQYKERRLKIDIDKIAAEIEARLQSAKSDAEIFGLYSEFVSKFGDGHVGLSFPLNGSGVVGYKVPLFVVPFQNKVIVVDIPENYEGTRIAVGDEVLLVDGKPPLDYLPLIRKYKTLGYEQTDKNLVFKIFNRDIFMHDLFPSKKTVEVKFQKASGEKYSENLVWQPVKSDTTKIETIKNEVGPMFVVPFVSEYNNAAANSNMKMGSPIPFFLTSQVEEKFNLKQMMPSPKFQAKYSLDGKEQLKIYVAIYKHKGKNILLVRNFTYDHDDFSNESYLNGYRAILDELESLADVLVIDQTRNGGGSYCESFFRLFINEEKPAFVQALKADRKWIRTLQSWSAKIAESDPKKDNEMARVYKAMADTVEEAYDKGEAMTALLPIMNGKTKVAPDEKYHWKKPVLVLVDEMSGSCADAFPMLMKNSGVAKIFGKRTMGLGGSVETVITLPYSQSELRLTRGLFTSYRENQKYPDKVMIENNGVVPDYPYDHTVEDFRNGFVKYVEAFSDKAVQQIKNQK